VTGPTRDLLTPAECEQLRSEPGTFHEMLQAAARLGAERERERCAQIAEQTVCDVHLPTGIKIYGRKAAAAIRRGEGATGKQSLQVGRAS
jgi:hypothetical protein